MSSTEWSTRTRLICTPSRRSWSVGEPHSWRSKEAKFGRIQKWRLGRWHSGSRRWCTTPSWTSEKASAFSALGRSSWMQQHWAVDPRLGSRRCGRPRCPQRLGRTWHAHCFRRQGPCGLPGWGEPRSQSFRWKGMLQIPWVHGLTLCLRLSLGLRTPTRFGWFQGQWQTRWCPWCTCSRSSILQKNEIWRHEWGCQRLANSGYRGAFLLPGEVIIPQPISRRFLLVDLASLKRTCGAVVESRKSASRIRCMPAMVPFLLNRHAVVERYPLPSVYGIAKFLLLPVRDGTRLLERVEGTRVAYRKCPSR